MSENEAIPAATLVVVRERSGGGAPELLMVERAAGMAFAGGALVFPGGRIDPADAAHAHALPDAAARVAALRETIEETAIPVALSPVPDAAVSAALQHGLLDGRGLGDLLGAMGAALDLDALVPLARWVPKFHAARRFDTLFFLARAPLGEWTPRIVAGECSGALWVSAGDVLERDRNGAARLIFPTRRNLERLAQHATFEAMAADARAHSIEPITPWLEEHDGERWVTIPEGIGYPVTRERLDGLWRG